MHFLPRKFFLIRSLINYIDTHIYDKITLNDLAEFTEKHPTYLSTEFKNSRPNDPHLYQSAESSGSKAFVSVY